MPKEMNASQFRMALSNALEKYDVFMLRRNPLIQAPWNWYVNLQAKKQVDEFLQNANSVDELLDYIEQNHPDNRIVQYKDHAFTERDRETFIPLITYIGEDLKGRSFFDIGPGYGHSLDFAKEAGASSTGFIDIDPAYFARNVLNGHEGYLRNFIKGDGLKIVPSQSYDYVLSRGALNADQLSEGEPGIAPWPKLLDMIEAIWTGTGMVIINPTFNRGTDPDRHYQCRDEEAYLNSPFCKELLGRGYEKVVIDGFNTPHYFPYSFIRRG